MVTVNFDSSYNFDSLSVVITNADVYDEEGLLKAIGDGALNVTLANDIQIKTAVEVTSEFTLDLNGYSISAPEDTEGNGIFHVLEGGKLTINGEGIINGVGDNIYSIAIWADGGEVIINGGTFTNVGAHKDSSIDMDNSHYDLIYVKNGGTVTINGGEFICETPRWTLNSNNEKLGAIVVNGGKFYEFDPSNADTDDNGAGVLVDYVGDGYVSVEVEDGYYSIVEE